MCSSNHRFSFNFYSLLKKKRKKNSFLWLEIHSYQQSNLLRTVKNLTVLRCERNESSVQVGSESLNLTYVIYAYGA